MLTNPPIPYDFCIGIPISRLLSTSPSRGLLRDCTTSPINRFTALAVPGHSATPTTPIRPGRWLSVAVVLIRVFREIVKTELWRQYLHGKTHLYRVMQIYLNNDHNQGPAVKIIVLL